MRPLITALLLLTCLNQKAYADGPVRESWSSAPCEADMNENMAKSLIEKGRTASKGQTCTFTLDPPWEFVPGTVHAVIEQHTCNSGFANTGGIDIKEINPNQIEVYLVARTQRPSEVVHCTTRAHFDAERKTKD